MKQFSKALLVMTLTTASLSAWAQDVIVSGTVKDATGEPCPRYPRIDPLALLEN